MSNVCKTVQLVEEYIIPPARVAVMNVRDELAAQSPRKLFGLEKAQRARDTWVVRKRERSTQSSVISLVFSALHVDVIGNSVP